VFKEGKLMILYGDTPGPEVLFAMNLLMVRYNLTPADIMKVLAALDKEKPPNEGTGCTRQRKAP
jgi:hypothetical protein